jgi:hypothetical protein
MPTTTSFLNAGVAALILAAALSACSPTARNSDWVRQQFLELEHKHTAEGELFAAIRTSEPELYDKFIGVVGEQINSGKSFFEAGAAARPLYLERFQQLSATTNDQNANELLAFARDQMAHAQDIDPAFCVNLARGGADQRVIQLPKDITNHELTLMAHIIKAGDQHGATATAEEVQAWGADYVGKHPEMNEGLQMMDLPAPTGDQARAICTANIAMLDGLLAEEPVQRARLFRGSLAMSRS